MVFQGQEYTYGYFKISSNLTKPYESRPPPCVFKISSIKNFTINMKIFRVLQALRLIHKRNVKFYARINFNFYLQIAIIAEISLFETLQVFYCLDGRDG